MHVVKPNTISIVDVCSKTGAGVRLPRNVWNFQERTPQERLTDTVEGGNDG